MSKNIKLQHHIHYLSKDISKIFFGVINRISLTWWRIGYGRGCSFQGKSIFRRLPGSEISIGNGCTFLSNHSANLIGIYSPCMISAISKHASIIIGDNCGFSGTVIGAADKIVIGNNVRCGANTLITDTDWHTDDPRTGKNAPVQIDNNVWLGYGVKVLKGVHIGENSIIGAQSVVTKDIPANVMAAGNPCRVIKQLDL